MTAVVGIECDGCGKRLTMTTRRQPEAGSTRAHAKDRGWHKTRGIGGTTYGGKEWGYARDICPDCWTKGIR